MKQLLVTRMQRNISVTSYQTKRAYFKIFNIFKWFKCKNKYIVTFECYNGLSTDAISNSLEFKMS